MSGTNRLRREMIMAITIQCEQCGKTVIVPEQYAGKRARCPCGAIIKIPAEG